MGSRATVKSSAYWTPPPSTWAGDTVFLLGGGPSLDRRQVNQLRDRRVMVITSSAMLAPWADVLFFGDRLWAIGREELVQGWKGLAVTCNLAAKGRMPKLKLINAREGDRFPALGSGRVRKGPSSGHTAIGLAVALGASRIVLLGYDMGVVGGRSHHHGEYSVREPAVYQRFLAGFGGWRSAAEKIGVEIVNATPGSALKEFPVVALGNML
jgi:hypothetical protein